MNNMSLKAQSKARNGGFYVNSHTLTCHLSDFDKNL